MGVLHFPRHPPAVHIKLFNGRWRAMLNRADLVGITRLNLNKAIAYCEQKNADEGRQTAKTKKVRR